MKYKPTIVAAYFKENGIPEPMFEFKFHPTRKWRFDIAWPNPAVLLAIEIQGGIWIRGGHNRGAQMKKDWEKYNAAAVIGWRILYVEPRDLCTLDTVNMIKDAL